MDVKMNAIIKPHPAGVVDLEPENTETFPEADVLKKLEQVLDEVLPETLKPPKVERQMAFAGGTFDPPQPLLPMRAPTGFLYTPPPPLAPEPTERPPTPKGLDSCCFAPPTPDIDLNSLAWLLAGTFLVGAITGVLGVRSFSSKIATAAVSA
jgi:hypothetical protein